MEGIWCTNDLGMYYEGKEAWLVNRIKQDKQKG